MSVKPMASRNAMGISLGSLICERTLGTVARIAKQKMKADKVIPALGFPSNCKLLSFQLSVLFKIYTYIYIYHIYIPLRFDHRIERLV